MLRPLILLLPLAGAVQDEEPPAAAAGWLRDRTEAALEGPRAAATALACLAFLAWRRAAEEAPSCSRASWRASRARRSGGPTPSA